MKKKHTLLIAGIIISFVFFSASVTCAWGILYTSPPAYKTPETLPVFHQIDFAAEYAPAVQNTNYNPQPVFIIRLIDNEVRVITVGNEHDYLTLSSIDPRTLREGDITLLTEGIELYSQAELQVFLEDFSS